MWRVRKQTPYNLILNPVLIPQEQRRQLEAQEAAAAAEKQRAEDARKRREQEERDRLAREKARRKRYQDEVDWRIQFDTLRDKLIESTTNLPSTEDRDLQSSSESMVLLLDAFFC
jgi:hypothetical protein